MTDQTNEARFADDGGRFRLDSRIATGGMGEVWRATDTVLARTVAVKLLKAEYADDATFRVRFETEARHAAALHHPGVASVFDVGESTATDGSEHPRPFLVMELVEGEPLSTLLTQARDSGRTLDPGVVRDLMAQAGEALGAAHRAGIVHRDVKPANLMVTPGGTVKVTDFGIARAADGVGITRTGAVMGTPQYLSPEQAEGKQATSASDVYALGVVTFECLAGRRPFEAETPVATALAHLRDPIPDLPDSVPDDLARVVRQSLAKDPAERYPDGDAFGAALRDPATAVVPARAPVSPVVSMPVDPSTQVMHEIPPEPVPVPLTTSTTTTTVADDRRSVWPIVAVVVLLVLLAVLITVLVTRSGGDTTPTNGRASRSSTSTSAPPTSSSPATSAPATINLDPSQYQGRQFEDVQQDLQDLNLNVTPNQLENNDPSQDGVVTTINPTGTVTEGQDITVSYYGDAPSQTPTSTPPSTPTAPTTPTAPSTPTAPTGPGGSGGPGGVGPAGAGPPGQQKDRGAHAKRQEAPTR